MSIAVHHTVSQGFFHFWARASHAQIPRLLEVASDAVLIVTKFLQKFDLRECCYHGPIRHFRISKLSISRKMKIIIFSLENDNYN